MTFYFGTYTFHTEQKEQLDSLERTCKAMEVLFGLLREGEEKG